MRSFFGSKRAITSPFRLTRNLLKFHLISPANLGLVASLVRNSKSGSIPLPLTTIFEKSGKLTLYLVEQNSLISSLVPGSCLPNSLAGKARTSKPLVLVFLVDRLEILVLRSQAALAGRIDDQQDLALVAGQVDVLAFDVLDVKIKYGRRFLGGVGGRYDREGGDDQQSGQTGQG